MITVSLCMIVKNEELTLGRCLDSVKDLVDEIVIVDTGSTDRTKDIAGRYTDKIHDFAWIDDFSAARNFSFGLAAMDYILWLDADDSFPEKDREKFMELKRTLDPDIDSVAMEYRLTADAYGNPSTVIRRNRLVKRSKRFRWQGPVHEYLVVGGNVLFSDIGVIHRRMHKNSDRNLKIYENRIARGETFSHRDRLYYANELTENHRYKEAIENYLQFFAEPMDYFEDNMAACDKIAHCYRELGDKEKELGYLLKVFEYDIPRADFCCRIAFHFEEREDYRKAAFWYSLALELKKPENYMGAMNMSCWTWLPHIRLVICYGKLGQLEKAYEHNEVVRSYFPDDPNVLQNKQKLEEAMNG